MRRVYWNREAVRALTLLLVLSLAFAMGWQRGGRGPGTTAARQVSLPQS